MTFRSDEPPLIPWRTRLAVLFVATCLFATGELLLHYG